MASAFWTLEDGRVFIRRWSGVNYILELIVDELKHIQGAEAFYDYLEFYIFREEKGDIYNGFGGFIRNDENIMFNFDLRSFAPKNRAYFWTATQKALATLIIENKDNTKVLRSAFITLLDMHKRIKQGEDPMILNHSRIVEPGPEEQLGPGWD